MRALVTGGCGFIGSHVVRALLAAGHEVTNLDKLTYASNPAHLADIAGDATYRFVEGDICDTDLTAMLVREADAVLNFAAETHVDRSLLDPVPFVRTDVEGVVSLLEAVRKHPAARFVHMSTDEVFGTMAPGVEAAEDALFAPNSPYSASKAAAELQIRAYAVSYGLPISVLRCCNVYGPHQHLEKFIPLFTTRALAGEELPLYGDGRQEREWLFIDDLLTALDLVLSDLPSAPGVHALHVGSGERLQNIDVALRICDLIGVSPSIITPVTDRSGHDRQYALDASRLRARGWEPRVPFDDGLARTVRWYADQAATWGQVATKEFEAYMKRQYGARLG